MAPGTLPISGPPASGPTIDRQPPARTRLAAETVAPATPEAAPRRGVDGRLEDIVAGLIFVGCSLVLFRLSLFQGWTFIGDSDRLNTVLNVRLFEVLSILQRGSVPTWSEQQFMGYGIVGLHWMLPGAPPLPQLLALLPTSELYHALAALAAALLVSTMAAAYWALGAYATGPVQRVVGALLYATGTYTVHKLTQLDLSFAALIAPPILLRLVRTTGRECAPKSFLGMAACWAFLVLFTVLQEIAYIALLWGAYAFFRSVRLRTPWPVVVAGLAFAVGVVIGTPRVITIAADIPFVTRTETNIQTTAVEALRYFGDGLLGRSQGEQGVLRGATINMHEGVQLLSSGLAALAVIALGVLAPSCWLRFWGVALLVILSVALNAYFRPFYELEEIGLRGVTYPSRELRTVAINAILIGLPLWLLGWWLTRQRTPAPDLPLADVGYLRGPQLTTHREPTSSALPFAGGRGGGGPHGRSDGLGGDPIAEDLPFFFGFVVLGLAAILIPEARAVLYYGFMKMDFLHSRISVAMTLPLAALSVIFLNRFLPSRLTARTGRWLAIGLGLGLALWIARELVATAVVAQIGPAVDAFRPRRFLTVETVRVVTSLLMLLAIAPLLVRRTNASGITVAGAVLASWIALEALVMTDHRLSGPQTTQQSRPFSELDYMQVAPGGLRIPTTTERTTVRERLEADRYRTVILQDRRQFLAMTEPHLAAFWDLRLVEGYSTGLPRRLGGLPWDEGMVAPHHLDIHGIVGPQDLPWRLLAALNVKYVVEVDRSFWFNPAPGGPVPPLDLARLPVWENPNSVTPRAFFTARVSPAGPTPLLPGDDGRRPAPRAPPIEDPARHSVAEGLAAERTFSTAGAPDATFDGDRVRVRLDPSTEDRFLVLNELYHPSWHAWVDGLPTTIYPTNVVMRGIVVPTGAASVELRYEPFIYTASGYGMMALGIVLVGLLAWGLRSIDFVPRAPFLARRR